MLSGSYSFSLKKIWSINPNAIKVNNAVGMSTCTNSTKIRLTYGFTKMINGKTSTQPLVKIIAQRAIILINRRSSGP